MKEFFKKAMLNWGQKVQKFWQGFFLQILILYLGGLKCLLFLGANWT